MKSQLKLAIIIILAIIISSACFAEMMISEIMYNPPGLDSKKEWIELYNSGPGNANISGWKIMDNSNVRNMIQSRGSDIIGPGSFAIIARNTTDFANEYPDYVGTIFSSTFALNNEGAAIRLVNTENETVDFVNYTNLADKGFTIEINDTDLDNSGMKNWMAGPFKGNPGQVQASPDQNTVPEFNLLSAFIAFISVGAIYVLGRNK